MKAFVLFVTMIGFTSGAWASKARVEAQQNAFDIVDVQTTFAMPSDIHQLGQLMTFELGATSATGAPKAEGGFLMKRDGAVMGAYLGHMNTTQTVLRSLGTAYPKTENPIDLFYGKNDWAAVVSISQSEDVQADTKQTTLSATYGKTMGQSKFSVGADLLATANVASDKYQGAPVFRGAYQHDAGALVYHVNAEIGSTKQDATGVDKKVDGKSLSLGALHRPMEMVYMSALLNIGELDIEGTKIATSNLPLAFGIEKDVFSWATLRASLKQNILLGESKNATAKTRNLNDTQVAVGMGFKHAGFTVDGMVAGSTTGQLNGNQVLTTAGLTYSF